MVTRDGRELVTTAVDGTVIREARTLRELRRLPVNAEQAALSPDGRTMLAGGRDSSVRFVDLATGETTARPDATIARWSGRSSAPTGARRSLPARTGA